MKTLRVEAYFSESGDKVSFSKNIRIRVDELLFIIYQNDYNLLKMAIFYFLPIIRIHGVVKLLKNLNK